MPFPKGKSGNPSGRPKKLLPDGRSVSDLAKDYTEVAVATLGEIMMSAETPAPARVSAAQALLDRGWGKAAQVVDMTIRDKKASSMTDEELEQCIIAERGNGATGKAQGAKKPH